MSAYSVDQTTTPEQQTAISNAILASITHGETWSVTSPAGDTQGASIAQKIMDSVQSQLKTTTVNPDASANNTPLFSNMGGGIPGASFTPEQEQYIAKTGSSNIVGSTLSWFQSNYANWGLIALGVILAIGALLISQKETIVNIGETAAKAAAVAA